MHEISKSVFTKSIFSHIWWVQWGNVWAIGAQNAGKSTLINSIGKHVGEGGGKITHLTEAPVPGTTLEWRGSCLTHRGFCILIRSPRGWQGKSKILCILARSWGRGLIRPRFVFAWMLAVWFCIYLICLFKGCLVFSCWESWQEHTAMPLESIGCYESCWFLDV